MINYQISCALPRNSYCCPPGCSAYYMMICSGVFCHQLLSWHPSSMAQVPSESIQSDDRWRYVPSSNTNFYLKRPGAWSSGQSGIATPVSSSAVLLRKSAGLQSQRRQSRCVTLTTLCSVDKCSLFPSFSKSGLVPSC